MPATEAQIRANQANSAKSCGPRTPEGKMASRANAVTHGLTATVVLPQREAAEVERRFLSFCEELQPSGDVGMSLVRVIASMSVRVERGAAIETSMLTERVRLVEAEFVAPEGVSETEAATLRHEAVKRAMFDDSKQAILMRKYETAALRAFFKALHELRLLDKKAKAVRGANAQAELASILPPDLSSLSDEDFEELYQKSIASATQGPVNRPKAELASILPPDLSSLSDEEFEELYQKSIASAPQRPAKRPKSADFERLRSRVDVPISAGKRR
jgi:hypothetical protein